MHAATIERAAHVRILRCRFDLQKELRCAGRNGPLVDEERGRGRFRGNRHADGIALVVEHGGLEITQARTRTLRAASNADRGQIRSRFDIEGEYIDIHGSVGEVAVHEVAEAAVHVVLSGERFGGHDRVVDVRHGVGFFFERIGSTADMREHREVIGAFGCTHGAFHEKQVFGAERTRNADARQFARLGIRRREFDLRDLLRRIRRRRDIGQSTALHGRTIAIHTEGEEVEIADGPTRRNALIHGNFERIDIDVRGTRESTVRKGRVVAHHIGDFFILHGRCIGGHVVGLDFLHDAIDHRSIDRSARDRVAEAGDVRRVRTEIRTEFLRAFRHLDAILPIGRKHRVKLAVVAESRRGIVITRNLFPRAVVVFVKRNDEVRVRRVKLVRVGFRVGENLEIDVRGAVKRIEIFVVLDRFERRTFEEHGLERFGRITIHIRIQGRPGAR